MKATPVPALWLADAVATFGDRCKSKLAGPGEAEAAIRAPIEQLLSHVGAHLSLSVVPHDEVRDTDRGVRPDYAISVKGAITGYVEVKKPGASIDPDSLTGHNLRQWQRQRDLPNLIYTNGTEWRLYRDSQPVGEPVHLTGGTLYTAGSKLAAPEAFEQILTDFLRWQPAPITSVAALVRAVAPLTRLLRGEVEDQLVSERRALAAGGREWDQPFLGLARDWRTLLFPTADDETFADGYAQAVTFALLLARTEGIQIGQRSLHEIGAKLGDEHSLMGRALQLLTDDVAEDFKVILDLLVRVVSAVDWGRVRKGRRDTYLHLYEHFLDEYDSELRQSSGSYYTPREVVDEMVRLVEECLATRLDKPKAFLDPSVVTVDPAMGTGTFLHTILERIVDRVTVTDGPGAVAGELTKAADRLNGFELQMGPFAVAELRASDLLKAHKADPPAGGLHFYVTDTLDDPTSEETQIASGLQLIAESRRRANTVKAQTNVTVVIGNPPYDDRAQGRGGWVEHGSAADGKDAVGILADWHDPDTSRHFHNLKNLYVYFWRWATWKVWESTPLDPDDGQAGIVCFISTSGYVGGPGFTAMRRYLREHASEGWIIDLTPEGHTPDVATRIFPGVRQPLAIGLFVRHPHSNPGTPATVHYRALHGRKADKFAALHTVGLDDHDWQDARTEWTAPFTPASTTGWDYYPALNDLLPWTSPGVTGNRRWPIAPSQAILEARWTALQSEPDDASRRSLLKETRDRKIDKLPRPLPAVSPEPTQPLSTDRGPMLTPVRIGYRSFDRQWIIPDARILDMPRADLWDARVPGQVFAVEQHSDPVSTGPGLVFTSFMPDLHHFNGRGGRALPLLNPDGSANLARGLVAALQNAVAPGITANDVLAYVASLVAHPGYTQRFAGELTTPGIRVPIATSGELFARAVELGKQVLWLHTYGETYSGEGRTYGTIRFPVGDDRQPLSLTPITSMPETITFDAEKCHVLLGDSVFGPVLPEVWTYAVGGKNVLKSWFNYRKTNPGGKKTSPLDSIHIDTWDSDWTTDFVDLLTLLTRLVALQPDQQALLDEVLSAPVLTRAALAKQGVQWPQKPADRKPRRSVVLDF